MTEKRLLRPAGLRLIGLTGGMGAGKGQVAAICRRAGICTVNADGVGHRLLATDPVLVQEVIDAFGKEIISSNGQIDRAALAKEVFASKKRLYHLNDIVHVAVFSEISRRLQRIATAGIPVCILESALLIETQIDQQLDGLIVVLAPMDLRKQRVTQRDGITSEAFDARCRHQVDDEARISHAHWVIHNDGTRKHLWDQVISILPALARPPHASPPERTDSGT